MTGETYQLKSSIKFWLDRKWFAFIWLRNIISKNLWKSNRFAFNSATSSENWWPRAGL